MRSCAVVFAALPLVSAADGVTFSKGYVRKPRKENVEVLLMSEEEKLAAPTSIDWSQQGATSPVKNQGQCGSCWAFSTTEGIESAVYMATKTMPILSTEQIVDCDSQDNGCGGGDPASALAYVESAGGIDTAADYPDTSSDAGSASDCSWDQSKAAVVTGWQYAITPCQEGSCDNQDEVALAAALVKHGPISICLNAGPWNGYYGGIFEDDCSGDASSLDHCVQLVGYDRSGSQPYWKVRNSWGPSWGEDGFIRLPFGQNACGVADEPYVIQATSVGPSPSPSPSPVPSPSPSPVPSPSPSPCDVCYGYWDCSYGEGCYCDDAACEYGCCSSGLASSNFTTV